MTTKRSVEDLYLLFLHEEYMEPAYPGEPRHPAPINATLVPAAALLRRDVPQPDGGNMYRCLTEAPGRTPGSIIPLSTLTHELAGGHLWPAVANWEAVVDALVRLGRARKYDSMPMGLPSVGAALLSQGPNTEMRFHTTDPALRGPFDREEWLQLLQDRLQRYLAEGPFWPGADLLEPSSEPEVMPYQPFVSTG